MSGEKTIQVKVEFREGDTISDVFPITDAVDDVRKWALEIYKPHINNPTSQYTLFFIDPETNKPVRENFTELKDFIRKDYNVLEFMLEHEADPAG